MTIVVTLPETNRLADLDSSTPENPNQTKPNQTSAFRGERALRGERRGGRDGAQPLLVELQR